MIVPYADCLAIVCDHCGIELWHGMATHTEQETEHHFCGLDCEWAWIDANGDDDE